MNHFPSIARTLAAAVVMVGAVWTGPLGAQDVPVPPAGAPASISAPAPPSSSVPQTAPAMVPTPPLSAPPAPQESVPAPSDRPANGPAPPAPTSAAQVPVAAAQALAHSPERLPTTVQAVTTLLESPIVAYRPIPKDAAAAAWYGRLFLANLDAGCLFFTQKDVRDLTETPEARTGWSNALSGQDLSWLYHVFHLYQDRQAHQIDQATAWLAAHRLPPADATWVPDPLATGRAPPPVAHPLNARDLTRNDTMDGVAQAWPRADVWPATESARDQRWVDSIQNDRLVLLDSGTSEATSWSELTDRLQRQRQELARWTDQDAVEEYLHTVAQSVDPHADYMAPTNSSEFQQLLGHFYTGIGVMWREDPRTGAFRIAKLIPNSPATTTDLKVGDSLIAVGSDPKVLTPTAGLRMEDVIALSQGPVGSNLYLDVDSKGQRHTVAVPRAVIHMDQRTATAQVRTTTDATGRSLLALVIKVPDFYADPTAPKRPGGTVTDDIRSLLRQAQTIRPGIGLVVLDLRDNPGGLLTEAVRTVGLFVRQGPVVSTRRANGVTLTYALSGSNEPAWTGPLAVLVDHATASAAEIVSGALQDHDRAIVLGTTTYGKGSAQDVIDLDRIAHLPQDMPVFGQVHVTTAAFFRPLGRSPQRIGVIPDVRIDDAPITLDSTGMVTYTPLPPQRALPTAAAPNPAPVGERANPNALPPITLGNVLQFVPAPAVGPDPWQGRRPQLQADADRWWSDQSWARLWNAVHEAPAPTEVPLDPAARRTRDADHHALVSALTAAIDAAHHVPTPPPSGDGPDVVLESALAVADDAFTGVAYARPYWNPSELQPPDGWTEPTAPEPDRSSSVLRP